LIRLSEESLVHVVGTGKALSRQIQNGSKISKKDFITFTKEHQFSI
jgi:hypothetical protein